MGGRGSCEEQKLVLMRSFTDLSSDLFWERIGRWVASMWARLLYAVDVSPKESVPRGVAMASYTVKVVTILAVACLSMSHTVSISLRPQRSSRCKCGPVLRVYDGSYYEVP